MGSTNFSEQIILAELYGQVLEANGYTVERRLNLGNREIVFPALSSGQIDMYAEYLAHALAFVDKDAAGSSNPAEAHRLLGAALAPMNISVLDYAPAVDTTGFVVTRATAARYNLTKLSDLQAVAGDLRLGGPPECPQRPFCILGLERVYGVRFKEFRALDAGGPLTVQALVGNEVEVAVLFTTDAQITARDLVLLEGDRGLQEADNVAPVVRTEILNRAPDLATLANSVSRQLTTAELTELNRQVGIDRQDPRNAAAAWLRAKGLVR